MLSGLVSVDFHGTGNLWSFEPYVEFVPYSTRVLGSKGWAVGRGIGPPLTTPRIAGFRSLDAFAPAPTPSKDCPHESRFWPIRPL